MRGAGPEVEFLWWRGCPSWERALSDLRAEMQALGLDPRAVALREVETEQDASNEAFVGSPTIRIGGEDIQATSEPATGLTCRVYRLRDGRISALPDRADVRERLQRSIEGSA